MQNIIVVILLVIYIIDNIISFSVVIKFRGLDNKYKNKDNTEEITKMIKKTLQKSFFLSRIKKAYPRMQIRFDNFIDEINKNLNKFDIRKK